MSCQSVRRGSDTSNATHSDTSVWCGILRQPSHASQQPIRCANSLAHKARIRSLLWPACQNGKIGSPEGISLVNAQHAEHSANEGCSIDVWTDERRYMSYIARNSSSFLPLFLPPRKPFTMTAGMVSPAAHHACTMVYVPVELVSNQ